MSVARDLDRLRAFRHAFRHAYTSYHYQKASENVPVAVSVVPRAKAAIIAFLESRGA
ncbi:ribonuclease toxin HepT-like protein [Aerophototrophica crusticola]|uniref:ribonuclease toxin HepT-like protein n=1 Tax=Aerophototrophica crusticola TaxID=1709002 RepID=UPI000AA2C6D2